MRSAPPLDRYALVDTSDPDEAYAAITHVYTRPNMEFLDPSRVIRTRINHCQLQHMGLVYGACGTGTRIRYPETEIASQVFSIAGKCEALTGGTAVAMGADRSTVISPGETMSLTSDAEYERLVLQISSRTLADKLSAMTGEACSRVLKFDPIQNFARPAAKALRDHFLFLVDKVNTLAAPIPEAVLAEFEQMLLVLFLRANRHNYSHLLEAPPDVAIRQVVRAEEYLEAHWQQAITLEDLARITGASALGLFRSFKRYRGYSPMEFVNGVRLRHARVLLQRPQPGTTIAEVVSACCLADDGRFAGDYFRAFGEQPWQTLDRGRKGAGC
jgi:AraC-like DNA-binding protein